jgi:hypothetical protein
VVAEHGEGVQARLGLEPELARDLRRGGPHHDHEIDPVVEVRCRICGERVA